MIRLNDQIRWDYSKNLIFSSLGVLYTVFYSKVIKLPKISELKIEKAPEETFSI